MKEGWFLTISPSRIPSTNEDEKTIKTNSNDKIAPPRSSCMHESLQAISYRNLSCNPNRVMFIDGNYFMVILSFVSRLVNTSRVRFINR